jgi:putative ATP-binding cassette transporter
VKGLLQAVAQIWRLAAPYFGSKEAGFAWFLLLIILAVEFAQAIAQVMLSVWTRDFTNALQMRDVAAWSRQLGVFFIIAPTLVLVLIGQLYFNQWLQIRWRRWMTDRYLGDWLRGNNHYRMQLSGQTDNPDQRISIDVALFITTGLTLAIGLFGALLTLLSFVFVLWGLSERAPLPVMGVDYSFPGYLVFAALTVSGLGTILSHLAGRELIPLNFAQQRFEADFRFGLVRVRENSEQIALLKGEDVEHTRLMDRFGFIQRNWRQIMARSAKLGLMQGSYTQLMLLVPFLLISPALLTGQVMFGEYTQTSFAFGAVQASFAFFMTQYRVLAEWKAVMDRLIGFEKASDEAEAARASRSQVMVSPHAGESGLSAHNVRVELPNGQPLMEASDVTFAARDRALITGPSGGGKTTLFRAFAGIWPFGSGEVKVRPDARVMIVPQKPYLPIGGLAAAILYPQPYDPTRKDEVAAALERVGLSQLAARLDEENHWMLVLSLGEQQRVAVARALLYKPDILLLDESTASLDEPAEARIYALLHEALPEAAIVSIGHRSSLKAFHTRVLEVKPGDGASKLSPA